MKSPTLKYERSTSLTILAIARALEVPHGSKHAVTYAKTKKSKTLTKSIQNNFFTISSKCMINLIVSELTIL